MQTTFKSLDGYDKLTVSSDMKYLDILLKIGGEFDCCQYRNVVLSLQDAKKVYALLGEMIEELENASPKEKPEFKMEYLGEIKQYHDDKACAALKRYNYGAVKTADKMERIAKDYETTIKAMKKHWGCIKNDKRDED